MYRRILLGGVTAAVILGAGGTALALTGSNSTDGTASTTSATSTAATQPGKAKAKGQTKLLRKVAHAQIVRKGKDGFVTYTLIKGTVTSVSATSITVQAEDKKSETFSVNKDTKVRMRTNGKGAASSIDKVATGDRVLAVGTGTSTITAKRIVEVKK
jgi:ABC-type oligopeptide transport system substrate-binding subunit